MLPHYVALALRNIRGAPLASLVNLLTLAVGLVCFVTAYAFVTFWGSAERHFRNADDIYVLTTTLRYENNNFGLANAIGAPDVAAETLKSDFPAISKIARATAIDRQTMVASGERAVRMTSVAVDPEFLEIFDLPFVAGDVRLALAAPRTAVITQQYAAQLFGTENPIGKSVVIGNELDATVTGVVAPIPEPSHLGRSANARLPFDLLVSRDMLDPLLASGRPPGFPAPQGGNWFSASSITYLYLPAAGGLSADELAAQLPDFVARHVPVPQTGLLKLAEYKLALEPVSKVLAGTDDFFDTGLSYAAMLLLLGGLVLGVACVNYANLATARAARRVREIGVRKALGASPTQIAVQSLCEAAGLALAALVVALGVFVLVQPVVKSVLGAELDASFFSTLTVWPALAILVAAVTLAAGGYPAFVLSRVRPVSALATAQGRLGSSLFSTLLVGAQFGVASFLLIAVTVMSLQNAAMRRTALSAIEDPLVVIDNPTLQTKVTADALRERLEAVPQVRGVTEVLVAPWEGLLVTPIRSSADPTSPQRIATSRQVGFDFFEVFGVPLLAGRVFDREHAEDLARQVSPQNIAAQGAPQNIVVDRELVATLGLGTPEEAVDELVYRPLGPGGSEPPPPSRIIGVVESRTFSFFKGFLGTPVGAIYALQTDLQRTVARIDATDIDGALLGIDAQWKQIAPNVAIRRRFLDEVFESAYSQYVRINQLFGALAVMAFAICIAGLFGMAIFVAGRRRREIGVRKTLGGSTAQVVRLLLTSFGKPVLLANLIAWPGGYFAARAYLNQFDGAIALTPWPFVLSVAITLAIACLAVVGQTLRAARTTPAEVLRNE
jgi:putative ABC transport system permease protein